MEKRIDIIATQPEAYKAMSAMENYVETSRLSATHRELPGAATAVGLILLR